MDVVFAIARAATLRNTIPNIEDFNQKCGLTIETEMKENFNTVNNEEDLLLHEEIMTDLTTSDLTDEMALRKKWSNTATEVTPEMITKNIVVKSVLLQDDPLDDILTETEITIPRTREISENSEILVT